MKILVFAPHPDDEVIGCGGSILKHIAAGHQVQVAFVTSGEAGNRGYQTSELAKMRETEAQMVEKIMGLSQVHFLHQPDGYVQYSAAFVDQVTELIRSCQPDLVYVPHAADAHPDHRATHQVVLEAINRAAGGAFPEIKGEPWAVKNILGYEVWTPMMRFQVVSDISAVFAQKKEAIEAYKSQLQNVNYVAATEGLSRYRGVMSEIGEYAEVFEVLKLDSKKLF